MNSSKLLEVGRKGSTMPSLGIELSAKADNPRGRALLDAESLTLIRDLHRRFEERRGDLLADRRRRQLDWDTGSLPTTVDRAALPGIDEADWRIAPLPADLRRRRVEITGPVDDSKMVINMLSRGDNGVRADAAMLDFEDSMRPTWTNVLRGHENLLAAARGDLEFYRPASAQRPAKSYRLQAEDRPLLMVRCRGLHLDEGNVRVDGCAVSAGLFDLVLALSRTASLLIEQGRTPKLYIPKIEHHLEARWWGDLLSLIEERLDLPRGTVRVTCLIETLPAALQIEEILFQLRERVAGLNVGRWDKIFSDLKVVMEHADRLLANRSSLSMERPWMKAYAQRLIAICHGRGAFAMGGMSAFTPGRSAEEREGQTEKVREDKRLEAAMGHDGCWVSHPYFIEPALQAFEFDDQLTVVPALPAAESLLPEGGGPFTVEGLRLNLAVGIAYLEGWSRGLGCVAFEGRMEDLATLEISRAQTWQWLRHEVRLDDGHVLDRERVRALFVEEADRLKARATDEAHAQRLQRAASTAANLYTEETFRPFLTRRWSDGTGVGNPTKPGLTDAPLGGEE